MIDENDDRTVDEILENGTPEEKAWLIAKFDESDRKIAAFKAAHEQALKDHLKANGITLESLNHHIQQIKDLNHDVAKVTSFAKEKGMTKEAFSELWQELKADFKMDSSLIFKDWYGKFKASQFFYYHTFNFRLATELARLASGKVKARPKSKDKRPEQLLLPIDTVYPFKVPANGVISSEQLVRINSIGNKKNQITVRNGGNNDRFEDLSLVAPNGGIIADFEAKEYGSEHAFYQKHIGQRVQGLDAILAEYCKEFETVLGHKARRAIYGKFSQWDTIHGRPALDVEGGLTGWCEYLGESDKGDNREILRKMFMAGEVIRVTINGIGVGLWSMEYTNRYTGDSQNEKEVTLSVIGQAGTVPYLLNQKLAKKGLPLVFFTPVLPAPTLIGRKNEHAAIWRFQDRLLSHIADNRKELKSEGGVTLSEAELKRLATQSELPQSMINRVLSQWELAGEFEKISAYRWHVGKAKGFSEARGLLEKNADFSAVQSIRAKKGIAKKRAKTNR